MSVPARYYEHLVENLRAPAVKDLVICVQRNSAPRPAMFRSSWATIHSRFYSQLSTLQKLNIKADLLLTGRIVTALCSAFVNRPVLDSLLIPRATPQPTGLPLLRELGLALSPFDIAEGPTKAHIRAKVKQTLTSHQQATSRHEQYHGKPLYKLRFGGFGFDDGEVESLSLYAWVVPL
ncbi:hypothetical protein DL93DRAFT_2232874 [Clavulina sp. PMI_390]|nr:hypothetical protein DL93DRAFT_2232874 [Clavulina sp. PMI_390]